MSMLRLRAGGEPKSALGIVQTSPVIPIIDRMKRHHTSENWSLGFIEFDNGATALMVYSNVIHARSLGRGQTGISQIDGSKGTIVGEDIYVTPAEELQSGAKGIAHRPKRTTIDVDGVNVIQTIALELPEQTVTWENPLKHYPLSEGQIAVADELLSIANAILNDTEPEYGALLARQDQEMNIAMGRIGQTKPRNPRFSADRNLPRQNRASMITIGGNTATRLRILRLVLIRFSRVVSAFQEDDSVRGRCSLSSSDFHQVKIRRS